MIVFIVLLDVYLECLDEFFVVIKENVEWMFNDELGCMYFDVM